ncbi:MAG: low temperature requirement protein A [Acidimicrobiales bacterium]
MDGPHKRTLAAGWIRRPDPTEDFTANPVELFFDLAFVFAFAQLVSHLVHHPDVEGILEAALLFWMLWLPWSQVTWATNAVSANARNVQVILLVATVASVPMAASISTAFDDGGWIFTGSVAVILATGLMLLIMASPTGSPEWRSSVRYAIPNAVAVVFFFVGAAVDAQPTRVTLWLVGIAIIAVGTLGAGRGDWVIRPGHFAERHGLILIIALGEVIVALAVPVLDSLGEQRGLPGTTIAALTAAGIFAALLWWGYFDRPQHALEHRFAELAGRERSAFARDVYTYLHSLIVAGVILSAAALEEITLHPSDPLPLEFRVMLLIGLTMYVLAVEVSAWRAYHVIPPERAAGAIVLAGVLLLGGSLDGVWLLVLIDTVVLVTFGLESRRLERPTVS